MTYIKKYHSDVFLVECFVHVLDVRRDRAGLVPELLQHLGHVPGANHRLVLLAELVHNLLHSRNLRRCRRGTASGMVKE